MFTTTEPLSVTIQEGGSVTVPSGEVWEIEAASGSGYPEIRFYAPSGNEMQTIIDISGGTIFKNWPDGLLVPGGWTIKETLNNGDYHACLSGVVYK